MTTIWTIGHSTRTVDEFLGLLETHRIERLVDVRSYPSSKRQPWFNAAGMADWLASYSYTHLPDLGGRRGRQPVGVDVNSGWENPSFRNYADYMQGPYFADGLKTLETLAEQERTAYLCSEAVPWRCHRSLISDAFTVRDWEVRHILATEPTVHVLGAWGAAPQIRDGAVTYPSLQGVLL